MSDAFDSSYAKTTWVNNTTPINQTNLNHVENGIVLMQDRTNLLNNKKIDSTYVKDAIKGITFDETTGIFTFTKYDESTFTIDTLLEKVVTNFDYDATTEKLVLELKDGTKKEIDLSAFITQTEFQDTSTVAFTLVGNHIISASIKAHSIGAYQLDPQYLTDIQTLEQNALNSATNSRSYAVGDTNTRQNEETDNAKYYKEQTKVLAEYVKQASVVGDFSLDSNGNLVYEDNSVHVFTVGADGNLYYEVKGGTV